MANVKENYALFHGTRRKLIDNNNSQHFIISSFGERSKLISMRKNLRARPTIIVSNHIYIGSCRETKQKELALRNGNKNS